MFTKENHFLVEVLCMDAKVSCDTPASVAPSSVARRDFVGTWYFSSNGVLVSTLWLVSRDCRACKHVLGLQLSSAYSAQWVVDVCVWLLCVTESFIRDAWILFAEVDRRVKRCRNSDLEQNLGSDNIDEIYNTLSKAAAIGMWAPKLRQYIPAVVATACPAAPPLYWCWTFSSLQQQAIGRGLSNYTLRDSGPHYDIDFHIYVKNHVKQLLGHARAHRGQGEHDAAFSLSDWFRA